MSKDPKVTPQNDQVASEGRDTFSAWPILFDKKDIAGFTFNKETSLQSPFDDLWILFRFYIAESPEEIAKGNYQVQDAQLATVLSWRLTPLGLWIRGGFVQFEDQSPYKLVIEKMKVQIKKGAIGLTYCSDYKRCEIAPSTGIVSKMPLIAFSLYEKEPMEEDLYAAEKPAGSRTRSQ